MNLRFLLAIALSVAPAHGNPLIDSWGRYQLTPFAISIELPDAFAGAEGRSLSKVPAIVESPKGFVTISGHRPDDSPSSRGMEFKLVIARKRVERPQGQLTEKCRGKRIEVREAKGTWWCRIDPSSQAGDHNLPTHMGFVPTTSGGAQFTLWGHAIGEDAVARMLGSIRVEK